MGIVAVTWLVSGSIRVTLSASPEGEFTATQTLPNPVARATGWPSMGTCPSTRRPVDAPEDSTGRLGVGTSPPPKTPADQRGIDAAPKIKNAPSTTPARRLRRRRSIRRLVSAKASSTDTGPAMAQPTRSRRLFGILVPERATKSLAGAMQPHPHRGGFQMERRGGLLRRESHPLDQDERLALRAGQSSHRSDNVNADRRVCPRVRHLVTAWSLHTRSDKVPHPSAIEIEGDAIHVGRRIARRPDPGPALVRADHRLLSQVLSFRSVAAEEPHRSKEPLVLPAEETLEVLESPPDLTHSPLSQAPFTPLIEESVSLPFVAGFPFLERSPLSGRGPHEPILTFTCSGPRATAPTAMTMASGTGSYPRSLRILLPRSTGELGATGLRGRLRCGGDPKEPEPGNAGGGSVGGIARSPGHRGA